VDIAVVVNLRARRGSRNVARACQEKIPDARVIVSRSLDEAVDFTRDLLHKPPSLLVSAGGDGTVVGLLNALRTPDNAPPVPWPLGLLPLGTGNGWAHVMGAPGWRAAIDRLGRLASGEGPVPVQRFDLVEVCGMVGHVAGTGWDAELVDDFHAQKTGFGLIPKRSRNGLAGYLHGLFTRTIPRNLFGQQVEVEVINTGSDALGVDDEGKPFPLPGGGNGKVLYRGPMSVCGAGTTAEWGFGFRAFPFAGLVPRRFCMRVYGARALEATLRMRPLWAGAHPLPKMHTWLLDRCRVRFSRAVPFQIGGDRMGMKSEVEYSIAPEQVDVLDWRAMKAA
jgi:diacylglycerol kinase family enzyme